MWSQWQEIGWKREGVVERSRQAAEYHKLAAGEADILREYNLHRQLVHMSCLSAAGSQLRWEEYKDLRAAS